VVVLVVVPSSAVTVMTNVLSPTLTNCTPSPDADALESVGVAVIVTEEVSNGTVAVSKNVKASSDIVIGDAVSESINDNENVASLFSL